MTMHLLILNLTTSQATLRMRVWRTLKQSGAAVLRDGVYLLPDVRQGYDTFLSTCQAIRAEGGPGMFSRLRRRKKRRSGRYSIVVKSTTRCCRICRRCRGRYPTTNWRLSSNNCVKFSVTTGGSRPLISFRGPPEQAAERLATIEQVINQRLSPNEPQSVAGELSLLDRGAFRGRLWATRRRPWVDRLASAWLIRRFIDDEARFLWLAAPETCPATAVGFDFDGAPFSHVGTLVTFEVLVRRFVLDAVIPDSLGRLIHFLDVGGVPTPEAAGVKAFLQGCGKPLRTMTNCWRQLARCSTAY